MKYRKKPVVIEAFQWFESSGEVGPVVRDTEREGLLSKGDYKEFYKIPGKAFPSFQDHHRVKDGDWIITDIRGIVFPCKPDSFEQTYEPVEQP